MAVQHRAEKRRRLVPFEPGAGVDQQRETGRATLWKAILAEVLNLRKDGFRELTVIPALEHSVHDAVVVVLQASGLAEFSSSRVHTVLYPRDTHADGEYVAKGHAVCVSAVALTHRPLTHAAAEFGTSPEVIEAWVGRFRV